jgi:hypothetical protein
MDLRFSGKLLFFYCEFLFSNTFFFFYPGEPLLPKTPHVFVPSSASSKVFGSIQELASGAELNTFLEECQRRCVEGDVDEWRLEFENSLKLQSLLVLRRICCAANKVPYIGSLLDVAIDLWKPSPIQDDLLFIDLCCVIFEEFMGDHFHNNCCQFCSKHS